MSLPPLPPFGFMLRSPEWGTGLLRQVSAAAVSAAAWPPGSRLLFNFPSLRFELAFEQRHKARMRQARRRQQPDKGAGRAGRAAARIACKWSARVVADPVAVPPPRRPGLKLPRCSANAAVAGCGRVLDDEPVQHTVSAYAPPKKHSTRVICRAVSWTEPQRGPFPHGGPRRQTLTASSWPKTTRPQTPMASLLFRAREAARPRCNLCVVHLCRLGRLPGRQLSAPFRRGPAARRLAALPASRPCCRVCRAAPRCGAWKVQRGCVGPPRPSRRPPRQPRTPPSTVL